MPTMLPVVLVRVPPPGGKGRHKLTKREAAGGLFFGLADRYGDAAFAAYRNVGFWRRVPGTAWHRPPARGQLADEPADDEKAWKLVELRDALARIRRGDRA